MPTKKMQSPAYWQHAVTVLAAKDTQLANIIAQVGEQCIVSRGEPFETLLRSIVGQQISVKAAASIWAKVQACITPNNEKATPQRVLAESVEALRACGLSSKKVEYIQDLSLHFQAGTVNPKGWAKLDDEALIKELIQVKGIGVWTAQMVLMFNALRPDVFPIDDLAIRKGMTNLYGFADDKDGKKQMLAKSHDWAPWRSVASWLLWRSLDLVPIESKPLEVSHTVKKARAARKQATSY